MISKFLKILGIDRPIFYPFELRVIDEVKSRLGKDLGALLQRQIDVINKVQRNSGGKEVNLYQIRYGKPVFADELRFAHAPEEILLASANLKLPDRNAKLKMDLWLVKGRLFSLAYNKAPEQFFKGLKLQSVRPDILDVKIWYDTVGSSPVTPSISFDYNVLKGWLRDLYASGRAGDFHIPLSEAERSAALERIGAPLPSDYLELISQSDGAKIDGCISVYGFVKMKHFVTETENYDVVAEIDGVGAIGLKDNRNNPDLYLIDYENDIIRLAGTSFRKAVSELMELGAKSGKVSRKVSASES